MKVAFLFEKECPAYDLVFRVLQAIPAEDRDHMDTLISAGFWGFLDCCEGLGLRRADQMVQFLARLIHNQEGSLTRIVSDESMVEAVRGDTYAVIMHSIRRSLVLQLHDLLKPTEGYRGLIEVLPHLSVHRQIFGFCPPTSRVEQKSLFVLSTTEEGQSDEDDGSKVVDEMIEWVREKYPLLGLDVVKKHVGLKGSIFDRDSDNSFVVQNVVRRMAGQWAEIAEHVIYKLDDFAPDVVAELTSALEGLEKTQISQADCGQIATSLRRSLELLAELLTTESPEGLAQARVKRPSHGERYKDLLWNYLCKHFNIRFRCKP